MQPPPADPLVGRTLAHYEVVARLGGGGMGLVYAARDTRLGRRVALKVLPPQWSHDASAKERFMREAQAASATDHPNICTIHDIGTTEDGQLFIVMAHYDGDTLKNRLEAGPLPVDEAVDVAAQIAEGLAKAHAEGVVHRDIKPGNLMLTESGVKILDFGLAKMADARFKLTLEGSTVGTIAYMSPEQVRGDEADARSDVWGLGAVLYEMLAGQAPFKGGYPEAIGHAIRSEPPAPLRASRPEVSDALEQIVFRALHKDPAVRFQTARDLARALRRLQGRTLPLDLRTEPLTPMEMPHAAVHRRLRGTRRTVAAAAAIVGLLGVAPLWMFLPVERIPVAVAPVVNQTGYAELDPYRMALTQELTAQLAESRVMRVLPYERLLQIVRRFRQGQGDVSSREALQAIAAHSGARAIVMPTLLYENGAWRARIEIRNPATATNLATYDTDVLVSSLIKDATLRLTQAAAAQIDRHFTMAGPRRAAVAARARALFGRATPALVPRMRTLDGAAALERGLDAYEQQEHTAALEAFTRATELEPRNPLPFAWQSRVARLMRLDRESAAAAAEAVRLLGDHIPLRDRLLIQAMAAESQGDAAAAEALYQDLAGRQPDDPAPRLELAAFLDRQLRPADAVDQYLQVLGVDAGLPRPRLDLCRLYGPLRLNDTPAATAHGRAALAAYRALGHRAGEAQTLWCLADVLALGGDADRDEAVGHADGALRIFDALRYPYNLSRAYNYAALAATRQGRLAEAAALWERSLAAARTARNAGLEPQVLVNLGTMYSELGDPDRAVDRFQQAQRLYESLGEQQQAAQNLANAASTIMSYGGDLETAFRDIQNSLAVFRKLGDRSFEAFALHAIGTYHHNAGRYEEARRELNRARAVARERNLTNRVAAVTVDLAAVDFEEGAYGSAADLLAGVVRDGAAASLTHARIQLARVRTRLGDFEEAAAELRRARSDLRQQPNPALEPVLNLALGELAYESGQPGEARSRFAAAATGRDALAAGVEARAALGLVEALQGRPAAGVAALREGLNDARRRGRFSLEQRARVYLARVAVQTRRFAEALAILNEIPADGPQAVGGELRAQAHYWRSAALGGRGDRDEARAEAEAARALIDRLRDALPEPDRPRFAARSEIRAMVE